MSESTALSLANTELRSAGDLDLWLRTSGGSAEHAGELSLRLAEFVALRACLRDLLAAAAEGRTLPADAVEHLNDASARIPRIARLESGEVTQVPVGSGP